MSETIGRVDFTVALDGRNMPREAENIGRKAGAAAGEGYDETFSKTFRDTLTENGKRSYDAWHKNGRRSGTAFGTALNERLKSFLNEAQRNFDSLNLDPGFLDRFNKKFDDAGLAAGRLQRQLATLHETNRISTEQFEESSEVVADWADKHRLAAIRANENRDAIGRLKMDLSDLTRLQGTAAEQQKRLVASSRDLTAQYHALTRASRDRVEVDWSADRTQVDRLANSMERLATRTRENSFAWRDLSHNARQWILIGSAIAAGMSDIAVLGSAAGAGLVALGGAATGGIMGVGALAAVFVTLNKDLGDLPPSMRAVASEFQDFKGVFGELRQTIASGAFQTLPGVFDSLRGSLSALGPAFYQLGTDSGRVLAQLAHHVRPGSDAFLELQQLVRGSGPIFASLASTAGTFGTGLVRSFNRATPLVQDLTGWMRRLADQFDTFSRSRDFDDWIMRSQATFRSFGALLDAVSRSLNDLVTPAAVNRLTSFLDNLTAFMPNLTKFLDILGRLDVFGLLAQALNELGSAFEPLAPSVAILAEALNTILSSAITVATAAIGGLATAVAPAAQALASFLDAVPPGAWNVLIAGALGVAGAFAAIRAGGAIYAATTALQAFTTKSLAAVGASSKLSTSIAGGLGKAGAVGAAAAGVALLAGGLDTLYRKISDVDGRARNLVGSNASIKTSYDDLGRSVFGVLEPLDDVNGALDMLPQVGTGLDKFLGTFAATFSETGRQASSLAASLGEMDGPLTALANQSMPAAIEQFSSYAKELGASKSQTLELLNKMPEFKDALIEQSMIVNGSATDQELLSLALGTTGAQMSTLTSGAAGTTEALEFMRGKVVETTGGTAALQEQLRTLTEATYGQRDAARDYEQATADLTAKLAENGATLDITTQAGRDNQAAVDTLAGSVLALRDKTLAQTGSQEQANRVMSDGRQRLIDMLGQFGITGDAAARYADELGLIPNTVSTTLSLHGAGAVYEQLSGIQARLREVTGTKTLRIAMGAGGQGGTTAYAAGGIVNSPRVFRTAEGGPEAIVPLRRPLHQVDPSVRGLSAVAQGKSAGAETSSNGGYGVYVAEGAIVVQEAGDARRTGFEVLDLLAEEITG